MLVLGFRTSPTEVRYALLEIDGQDATFTNANGENRLKFPNGMTTADQKLPWLHSECERILRQNQNIEGVVIKTSEYGRRSETANVRLATYMEGVLINLAGQKNIPLSVKTYASLGTSRSAVKAFAAAKAGQSQTIWNEQMADAVAAAWAGRN
ncbi:MAG: hypothetical protein CBB87_06045 [Micavibrio sp. TMED27]|nr:hypothetical protein [Micavibrio sp.]OUT91574.1 MAG: hypothetical protein CBB87_06045 [Micavibrio sp. TMED27]|tara:strand:+ start:2212 stop:2670 length:459 start_codon:yes stop_codon:yes gene_type:complete